MIDTPSKQERKLVVNSNPTIDLKTFLVSKCFKMHTIQVLAKTYMEERIKAARPRKTFAFIKNGRSLAVAADLVVKLSDILLVSCFDMGMPQAGNNVK
ncbi:hypothetical protein Ddc_10118 [Ditylenchus destructor]|nr:hypothetical protein Ddc_10118 [Ditylenchus destructor]